MMQTSRSTFTLADLLLSVTGMPLPAGVDLSLYTIPVQRTVVDSRRVTPGSLFVALRGEHRDGHDYIRQAIQKGAVAILAERVPETAVPTVVESTGLKIHSIGDTTCVIVRDSLVALQKAAAHWRGQLSARVIGVTGSVGKTTSKEVIAQVLNQRYCTLRSEGNYNNEIGLPLTLLQMTAAHERAVVEMGMYDIGEISRLADIAAPQVGVVTNVGPTHLERLGTVERIAQAKAELLQALPPADEGGVAVLNADDELVRAMAHKTRARVFTYGLNPRADLWADDIQSLGLEGIRFRFHHAEGSMYAHVPILGRHSVHTALCAAAVGILDELSWEEILAGLQDSSDQLRLVVVPGPADSIILDDTYNASPASNLAALNLLAELDGRKIAVLGDMYELGHYEEEGHRLVGQRARDVVDRLIVVGQLGQLIGREAVRAGMPRAAVHFAENNQEATSLLTVVLTEGSGQDRILIKGSRGAGMEVIVSALTQPTPRPIFDSQDGGT